MLKKCKHFKNIYFCQQKKEDKKAILLVLKIEEISIRPELSSPPRIRIQNPEHDKVQMNKQTEILMSCIGLQLFEGTDSHYIHIHNLTRGGLLQKGFQSFSGFGLFFGILAFFGIFGI